MAQSPTKWKKLALGVTQQAIDRIRLDSDRTEEMEWTIRVIVVVENQMNRVIDKDKNYRQGHHVSQVIIKLDSDWTKEMEWPIRMLVVTQIARNLDEQSDRHGWTCDTMDG